MVYWEAERVQYILCAGKLVFVHRCGPETDLVPAVVGRVAGFCVLDHAGDFLEIVLERVSVRLPGAVDGRLVVPRDSGRAPRARDKVEQRGCPDEIRLAGAVEERLDEGTQSIDDVPDAGCDVLCEGRAVEVVVKETGAVGEGGDVLGEIAEHGGGCGVGGRWGPEREGELGGEKVYELEEGGDVCADDMEGCGVCGGGGEGGECVRAGLGHERERHVM